MCTRVWSTRSTVCMLRPVQQICSSTAECARILIYRSRFLFPSPPSLPLLFLFASSSNTRVAVSATRLHARVHETARRHLTLPPNGTRCRQVRRNGFARLLFGENYTRTAKCASPRLLLAPSLILSCGTNGVNKSHANKAAPAWLRRSEFPRSSANIGSPTPPSFSWHVPRVSKCASARSIKIRSRAASARPFFIVRDRNVRTLRSSGQPTFA